MIQNVSQGWVSDVNNKKEQTHTIFIQMYTFFIQIDTIFMIHIKPKYKVCEWPGANIIQKIGQG